MSPYEQTRDALQARLNELDSEQDSERLA